MKQPPCTAGMQGSCVGAFKLNWTLIAGVLPGSFLGIGQVAAVLVLQTVDEGLRDGTIDVLVGDVGGCFGIEGLCTSHERLGAREGLPALPLADELTRALVQDEVDGACLLSGNTELRQDSLVLGGKVLPRLSSQAG